MSVPAFTTDTRLNMMADQLIALPTELFNKIMGILDVNQAATRIQRMFRGLNLRLQLPIAMTRPALRTQLAWQGYGHTYIPVSRRGSILALRDRLTDRMYFR